MAPKRLFYEDDDVVITKPGFNVEISDELKQEESSHGNISFIKGMGIRTAPILEQYFNKARLVLHENVSYFGAELGTQKSAINNEYNNIKGEINSVIREPVLPNLIYILTTTLTGSILVNRRSLPVRFITPVAFAGIAFNYFMPRSYNEVTKKFTAYEKENFPEIYKNQLLLKENYHESKKNVSEALDSSKKLIECSVRDARIYLTEIFSGSK